MAVCGCPYSHCLKGVPLSLNLLFVKRDDQVMGLTNLLTIAVRLLTLIEFVVRRKLKKNHEKLTGLIENNPKKGIDNPTTERLLKAFNEITLTIVHLPGQIIRYVTPLTDLQTRILELLGLSATIYTRLAENRAKSKPFQRIDSITRNSIHCCRKTPIWW